MSQMLNLLKLLIVAAILLLLLAWVVSTALPPQEKEVILWDCRIETREVYRGFTDDWDLVAQRPMTPAEILEHCR